jgi:hypothetical protein
MLQIRITAMFNEMSTPTVPYDQDERFEGLDELVSALEAKWLGCTPDVSQGYYPDAIAEELAWEREIEMYERDCPN